VEGSTAILLVSCRDQKGIVAGVASFIYEHGGNIVHAEQHIDVPENIFFHRVEWQLGGFSIAPGEVEESFKPIAERFGMSWQLRFSNARPRIAIFVSKYDHCLVDLLYRHRIGELPAEIAVIISNHPDLEHLALSYGVPYEVFSITPDNKDEQEITQLKLLQRSQVELIVLARYMQILTPRFVHAYPKRIINIHHSFLPAFIGKKPYDQAYERGVKLIGATSHYVTEELDAGPIIAQDVCRVTHRDSLEEMVAKGRHLERQVLGRGVRLHLLHRVLPYGRKTVVFD
jgi:formyltetrahydrofolate deformylase